MVAERDQKNTGSEWRQADRECQKLAGKLISTGGQDVVHIVHDILNCVVQ